MCVGAAVLAVVLMVGAAKIQPSLGPYIDNYLVNVKAETGQQ